MLEMNLEGKVALVTGGNSGIGRATAVLFARAGARVVIAARRAEEGTATVAEIRKIGGEGMFVPTDVARAADAEAVVRKAVAEYGRLDYAFNNAAGGPMPAPLADLDPAEFDLGIATHIRGTFLGMKFQIGAMLASGGGAIVNMASVAGVNGTANLAAYVAGKAGIIGLIAFARGTPEHGEPTAPRSPFGLLFRPFRCVVPMGWIGGR
jgi:NAD(P)-dependent dehydrogenase (short-subunit alcohol dehydrogenase family)